MCYSNMPSVKKLKRKFRLKIFEFGKFDQLVILLFGVFFTKIFCVIQIRTSKRRTRNLNNTKNP